MKKIFVLILISMFFTGMSYSQSETMFVIHTDYGDMKGVLYDKTPGHRDNFIKLIKEGWFNGSTFHRVIKAFMIQGGGKNDGSVDVGYTIPAEIYPDYFHKKGALAAARQGDNVNPEKRSSGSQFYIVQGKKFTDDELDLLEQRMSVEWTPEQREVYKTTGGTPHLDFGYTVFGEITEGLDVIDKIAAVKTGYRDKPEKDVTMTIELIK
ncbi:MAG TPA: peptidylprolyl isomerase [Bacteroidales bacterium]|nr:peptidylprolyl isomerase [Bacteroidales bacterium]